MIIDPKFIGWTTIGSVAAWLLQFVFLGLMYSVAVNPFGLFSDLSYMLGAVLLLPLMAAFYFLFQPGQKLISTLALIPGIIGVFIINVSQFRLIIKNLTLEQNMPQVAVGTSLIGVAILLYNLLGRSQAQFSTGLTGLGIVVGVLMAFGIFVGLFFGRELFATMTGQLDWSKANPFMLFVFAATFLSQLIYPVWGIWLGRLLVQGKLSI